jgi:UDP-N-acetylmuramate dehydrogenase
MTDPSPASSLQVLTGRKLRDFTTMGVGGEARAYAEAADPDQLRSLLNWARAAQTPTLILGGGSNLLVSDKGFSGLVIRPLLRERTLLSEGEDCVLIRLGAGEVWDDSVAWTLDQSFAGLEALSGIPGSVGACPIQNIGAYGQEVARTIETVEVLDQGSGFVERLAARDCGFSYRDSRFKSGPDAGRFVVLAVEFRLKKSSVARGSYGELRERLSAQGLNPDQAPLKAIRQAVLSLRASKGMVLRAEDRDSWSCGSFFMNPILDEAEFERLIWGWRRQGKLEENAEPPRFAAGSGMIKTSAAWLIQRAGFHPGFQLADEPLDGAAVSSKHCLALCNKGQATAAGIHRLAHHIRATVFEYWGVKLEPEPVFVGLPGLDAEV